MSPVSYVLKFRKQWNSKLEAQLLEAPSNVRRVDHPDNFLHGRWSLKLGTKYCAEDGNGGGARRQARHPLKFCNAHCFIHGSNLHRTSWLPSEAL